MKRRSIRKLLVPVDFSSLSVRAIKIAQQLGRSLEASVRLVHVREYDYPAGFMAPGAAVPTPMVKYGGDAAGRVAAKFTALAQAFAIPTNHCYLESGAPVFHQICRLAHRIEADMIVMLTHGYSGVARFFEGSTAERIVQHAPCPVYVGRWVDEPRLDRATQAGKNFWVKRIMVPVDFSECSFSAVKFATEMAARFRAGVILYSAVHLGYVYTADGYAMYDLARLETAALQSAEQRMREFVKRAKFGAIVCETKVEPFLPADGICAYAEKSDADLVVMSTHGRTGFKHVMMGSVAEQVVRRSSRPVLVLPSQPEARLTILKDQTRLSRRISCGVSKSKHRPKKTAARPGKQRRTTRLRPSSAGVARKPLGIKA